MNFCYKHDYSTLVSEDTTNKPMSDKICCSDERSLEKKSTWPKKFETNLKTNIAFATQTLLAPTKKKTNHCY